MNKTDLIRAMAQKTGMTQKVMGEALEAALETITEVLVDGDEVKLAGFGKFTVSVRGARECTNPQDPTGDKIYVEESRNAKFKPSKALKEALN